jgi:hypothetical protein
MVKKLIEISNPNDGKGMEKFVKCYSDLTGKDAFSMYEQPKYPNHYFPSLPHLTLP